MSKANAAVGFAMIPFLAAMCAVRLLAAGNGLPNYPVKVGSSGRYLVDQTGVPFLIMGDSPQALFVNLSEADAELFVADRGALGFNTIWVNLLCATYTGGRADGSMYDGILPFTAKIGAVYDLTKPNPDYFARVDRIIAAAGARGVQVLLDPCETGSWLEVMKPNGVDNCRAYGRFLGSRYAGVDNIIWMSGNDFQSWQSPGDDAVALAVAQGIKDNDARHLHTSELDYFVSSSLDDARWSPVLGLNATYTYYPTYAQLLKDYNRANFLPNFMVEANYEFEHDFTGQATLRRQEYWTMTCGASGQLYGNGYTWPFADGWKTHLDTLGAIQFGFVKRLFAPRAWHNLVPDQRHSLMIAGYGTYTPSGSVNNSDYATAALASDASLAIVYLPSIRTITVDMSKMAAPVTASWYDPSVGLYTSITGSPFPAAGAKTFTPPGKNGDGDGDWVLVLETNPVVVSPPAVIVTSPAPGQTVAGVTTLSAVASSSNGIAAVQFQVDGVNTGGEDLTSPYTTSWDSTLVSNGAHTITAVARDTFLNVTLSDGVAIFVTNTPPPIPVNGLAAAYAFDETNGAIANDWSGNGNTFALHGPVFAAGKYGDALFFNGTSDYVEATNGPSLDIGGTNLTLAFWAKVNSTPSGLDYVLIDKPWFATAMTYPFYQFGVEFSNSGSKTFDFYFGDTAGALHGPHRMAPAAGVWIHAAYTYDGSVVKGYLNGVEQLSAADAGNIQPRGNSFRLGVDGAYAQFYNGAMDDLRVYDAVLTPGEIQTVMRSPVSRVSPPPRIDSFEIVGNDFRLSFISTAGRLYRLEYTADLASRFWFSAASNILGTGGSQLVSDANALDKSRRFYRLTQDAGP